MASPQRLCARSAPSADGTAGLPWRQQRHGPAGRAMSARIAAVISAKPDGRRGNENRCAGPDRPTCARPDNSLFRRTIRCFGSEYSRFRPKQGIGRMPFKTLPDPVSATTDIAGNGAKFSEFPVKFPVLREIALVACGSGGYRFFAADPADRQRRGGRCAARSPAGADHLGPGIAGLLARRIAVDPDGIGGADPDAPADGECHRWLSQARPAVAPYSG